MIYTFLTSLAVVIALVAMGLWAVGFWSAMSAFRARLAGLASIGAQHEEQERKVAAAKTRAIKSAVYFFIALACAVGIALLRDLLARS